MPGTPGAIFTILQEIKELSRRKRWLAPAPIYAAVLFVLVAAVMIGIVAGEMRQAPRQGEMQPVAAVQETPAVIIVDNNAAPATPRAPSRSPEAGDAAPCRPVIGTVEFDFGWQEQPVMHDWRYHVGVDIGAAAGSTVKALYSGEVSKIYTDKDYGLTVVIVSGEKTVYYGSLAGSDLTVGQQVVAGEKIGAVGKAALEPGSHLHLAIKVRDKYINPREILAKAQ